MPSDLRGFVEEWSVTEALNDARDKWSGADVAWENATWTIVHDPESPESKPLNDTGTVRVAVFQGARSIGQPTIILV